MMKDVARLAVRNLYRRRLRTGLTLGMIFAGTALIVFTLGLSEGTYTDLISLATRTWAGHFHVTARGYHDKPSLFKTVEDPEGALRALAARPEVVAVTRRVESAGLLAAGNRTTGVLLHGVEATGEGRVTTLPKAERRGAWLDAPPARADGLAPVVLGAGVAKRLRVEVGDEVSFIGQAADGSIAAERYGVVGIVTSGGEELDATAVWMEIGEAQALLALGHRVHALVGIVKRIGEADGLAAELTLPGADELLSWKETLPALHQTIAGDRAGNWIFIGILLAVVALGVANTMTMVVMERTREFGVMMALGATRARVVGLVLTEAAWVTGLGAAVGLLVGIGANLITQRWGIPVASEPINYGGMTIAVMRARNDALAVVLGPGLVLAAGFLATLLPALRAARLVPAEALRER